MRILPVAAALTAFLTFDAGAVRAVEGPWCAFINLGTGNVYEDCQYFSLEACVSTVLAGNRGFCNLNPDGLGHRRACRPDGGSIATDE